VPKLNGVLCFMRGPSPLSSIVKKFHSDTPTQSFWNPDGAYMSANTGGGRSGLGLGHACSPRSTPLTLLPAAAPRHFRPCSDRALANLKKYVDSFRRVDPLNKRGAGATDPVATGRYPEDVYFGGNVPA
jgi:glucoamylase